MFQDPRRPAIYALSPEDQGILDLLHTREKEAAKEAYRMVERAVEEGTEEDWAIMEWYKETVQTRYRDLRESAISKLDMLQLAEATAANSMATAGMGPGRGPPRAADIARPPAPVQGKQPTFISDSHSAGDFNLHLIAVGKFCMLSRLKSDTDKKRVLYVSLDPKAQFRLVPDQS